VSSGWSGLYSSALALPPGPALIQLELTLGDTQLRASQVTSRSQQQQQLAAASACTAMLRATHVRCRVAPRALGSQTCSSSRLLILRRLNPILLGRSHLLVRVFVHSTLLHSNYSVEL
jgi:hypothetical protein